MKQSCSWCHHENDSGAELCGNCGHCANLPRNQCYCGRCRPITPQQIANYQLEARAAEDQARKDYGNAFVNAVLREAARRRAEGREPQ